MPKIPTFTSEARITEQAASVKSNVQIPLSQTIGTALAPVTKAVVAHGVREKNLENKSETLQLENKSIMELNDVIEEASRLNNKDKAYNLIQTESKIIGEKYANQASNNFVKNSFNANFLGEVQKGIFKTNTRVSKNILDTLDNEVSIKQNRLLTQAYVSKDPMALRLIKTDLEKLYEDSYKGRIDVDEYDKLIQGIPGVIEGFEVTQEISSNPKQAYINLMDKNQYTNITLKNRIQFIGDVKGVLLPEVRDEYKNFIAAAALGKEAPFDKNFAKEILEPKEYAKVIKEYNSVIETVSNVKTINTISNKDLSQTVDLFIKDAEEKNINNVAKGQRLKKIYSDALIARNKAMADDPVFFLTQTNDNIKLLTEELSNETNPNLKIQKKLALTDIFVKTQKDMGQPGYQIKVMSNSEASNFVERYQNGDQNMRIAMLQNLESEFGNYNSNAMLQLSNAGLPVTAELSSFFNNPKLTERFLSFDSKEEQTRLKNVAKDKNVKFNDIRSSIRDNLKDFEDVAMRGSRFNTSVALEKMDNIIEVLTYYTLNEMAAGQSQGAAEKAATNLIDSAFDIQDSFFVPSIYNGKNISASSDFIVEKSSLIKDFYLQDFDAVAFQSLDEDVTNVELNEAMRDQMKNFGEWRNKADGTGIVYGIVFNDGSFGPVINANGDNLEFNFDDTTLSIPGTDKDIDLEIRIKSQKLDPRGAYPAIPESIKRQEENKQVKLTRTR
tara:strand:- start:363 stop:2540 length:2178 start_codon:yes stop_codon:yes gene_type:complete